MSTFITNNVLNPSVIHNQPALSTSPINSNSELLIWDADTNSLRKIMLNQIYNVPYLEYAWVTAPNVAGQSLPSDTITVLYMNTELADLGNYGTLTVGSAPPATSTSSITLLPGTYRYEAFVSVTQGTGGGNGIFGLRRVGSTYISRTGSQGGTSDHGDSALLSGQFTLNATQALELTYMPINAASVYNSKTNQTRLNSTADADQRTTIKLWKIG